MGRMANVSAEVGYIPKRGRNNHFSYSYVLESDIMAALRPLLAKWGVFLRIKPQPELMRTSAYAQREGKAPELLYEVPVLIEWVNTDNPEDVYPAVWTAQAIDNSDKGLNKAYTACVKYASLKTFLISTGDDPDADEERGNAPTNSKPAAAPAPRALPAGPRSTLPSRNAVATGPDDWQEAAVVRVTEAGTTGSGTSIAKITFEFAGGVRREAALFGTGNRLTLCEHAAEHGQLVEVKLRSKEYRGNTEYQVEDVREVRGPKADQGGPDVGDYGIPTDDNDIPF